MHSMVGLTDKNNCKPYKDKGIKTQRTKSIDIVSSRHSYDLSNIQKHTSLWVTDLQ